MTRNKHITSLLCSYSYNLQKKINHLLRDASHLFIWEWRFADIQRCPNFAWVTVQPQYLVLTGAQIRGKREYLSQPASRCRLSLTIRSTSTISTFFECVSTCGAYGSCEFSFEQKIMFATAPTFEESECILFFYSVSVSFKPCAFPSREICRSSRWFIGWKCPSTIDLWKHVSLQ